MRTIAYKGGGGGGLHLAICVRTYYVDDPYWSLKVVNF